MHACTKIENGMISQVNISSSFIREKCLISTPPAYPIFFPVSIGYEFKERKQILMLAS